VIIVVFKTDEEYYFLYYNMKKFTRFDGILSDLLHREISVKETK